MKNFYYLLVLYLGFLLLSISFFMVGMLVGHLAGISEIPNELMYSADVILEGGLITSYGEKLPRVQQLMGNAEILTDDLSLLMRFFNPLRAIFKEKIDL